MDVTKVSLGLMLCHFIVDVCTSCGGFCLLCLKPGCMNESNSSSCRKEFSLNINSSDPNPKEGASITLTCVSDLPGDNLTFSWWKNGNVIYGNHSKLPFPKLRSSDSGLYNCSVNSTCGFYSAQYNLNVPNESVIILVVCGVAALVLVLIMGLAMKVKLKRDNARHRERRKQREQIGQSGGPAPFTARQA